MHPMDSRRVEMKAGLVLTLYFRSLSANRTHSRQQDGARAELMAAGSGKITESTAGVGLRNS